MTAAAHWLKDDLFIAASVCARVAPSKFTIVATPRTGSELLADLLNHHPSIRCEGEVLGARPVLPLRIVQGRAVRARLTGARAYGFKLMFSREQWDSLRFGTGAVMLQRLHDAGFTLIVLRRRNLVEQAISLLLAYQFGFHIRTKQVEQWQPVALSPEHVLARMVDLDIEDRWLTQSAAGFAKTELVYEEDLEPFNSQQRTVDRITDVLGLRRSAAATDLVRRTAVPNADRVANFEEILDFLRSTCFADIVTRHWPGA